MIIMLQETNYDKRRHKSSSIEILEKMLTSSTFVLGASLLVHHTKPSYICIIFIFRTNTLSRLNISFPMDK